MSFEIESQEFSNRQWRSMFGVSPSVCDVLWSLLETHRRSSSRPTHLLMALHFLRCYETESNNAFLFGCTEKTFREWSWEFVKLIAKLEIVSE